MTDFTGWQRSERRIVLAGHDDVAVWWDGTDLFRWRVGAATRTAATLDEAMSMASIVAEGRTILLTDAPLPLPDPDDGFLAERGLA